MPRRILTALPVYNEESHLLPVLAEIRQHSQDILVVDDGSQDRTPELLSREMDVRTITHERNLGYGAALRTAFEFAQESEYDVLVTIDCDGQHEPKLIPRLAEAVFAHGPDPMDVVSGSRYLQRFPGDSDPPADRRRVNLEITEWLNCQFGWQLTDAFCGFKAYHVPSLAKLRITELGYAMPLQVWVQAAALGWRIVEFPVPLVYLDEHRSFGGSLDDVRRRRAYYFEVLKRELAATSQPALAEWCGGVERSVV
jgi:glycosyltransferase involved in cell wall biosynthesis